MTQIASTDADRRVGVFSLRGLAKQVSRCVGYELEDVILENLEPGSRLIEPTGYGHERGFRARRWLRERNLPGQTTTFGAPAKRLDQDLDLFFFTPALTRDLFALDTISNWRQRSAKAVCLLQELWVSEFEDRLPSALWYLNQFDHVITCFYHTAEALADKLDVPVSYVPYSVDAAAFNPFQHSARTRWIDACAIGNMDAGAHAALWDWAEAGDRFYSFTTTGASHIAVPHKVHRRNLIQTLQRSQVFFTFMAKRVVTGQRAAQEEFGPRYFEGAAAGALQVGDAVRSNPGFAEHVNWEDAVFEAPYTADNMPELIEAVLAQSDRVDAARRRGVANCLLRHDHMYRWDKVREVAGLSESEGSARRRAELQDQARAIDPDVSPTGAA